MNNRDLFAKEANKQKYLEYKADLKFIEEQIQLLQNQKRELVRLLVNLQETIND